MNYIVVLAGGIGTRTGLKVPKQYHEINDELLINYLLKNIINDFDKLLVVIDYKYKDKILNNEKIIFVKNGNTRLESLQNGINELAKFSQPNDLIFIHDGARILLDSRDISIHKKNAQKNQGLITCEKAIDTMFKIENNFIKEVIKKQDIVRGFNPQSFFWEDISKNLETILNSDNDLDLSEILIKKGIKIKILDQISDLRKITDRNDIEWIEGFLKWKK